MKEVGTIKTKGPRSKGEAGIVSSICEQNLLKKQSYFLEKDKNRQNKQKKS